MTYGDRRSGSSPGFDGLVFAGADPELERSVGEAAEARAFEPRAEREVEDGARARLRHGQVGRDERRLGSILLPAEHERLDLHLDLVAELLAAAQP